MKNKLTKTILLSGLLVCSCMPIFAQRDTTCFRAMRDELHRNFNELQIPECPRPFFLSYLVVRGQSIDIDSSLGAITMVRTYPVTMSFVRSLVGNYHFNSEEAGVYQNTGGGLFPEESSYDEIRSYFWEATDAAYKNSIRSYAARQNRLHQQNISLQELPDDLSRIIPETTHVEYPLANSSFDKERCTDYVRSIAVLVDSYKELNRSSVDFHAMQAEVMVITTEGTEVVVPYNFVIINIEGAIYNFDNELANNSMAILVPTFGDLPNMTEFRSRVDLFVKELVAASSIKPLVDNYFGPVMLEGEAVASFVDSQLAPGMMNTKAPAGQKNVRLPEQKLDKRIAAQTVSIMARPRIAEYGGKKLWGTFEVDIDGVKPDDSLTLVKDGLLCSLLTNRVCTKKVDASNGYARFMLTRNGLGQMAAPGILDFSVSNSFPQKSAKEQLIEQARLEGLEYAYIIRSFARTGNEVKVPTLYKVYVADGREEIGPSALMTFESTVARRIVSASQEKAGYNRVNNGVLCSYICPQSLIVNEVDIAPFESSRSQPPVVADPRR